MKKVNIMKIKIAKTSTRRVAAVNINIYSNINKEHQEESTYTTSNLARQTRQGKVLTINIHPTSKGEKEARAAIVDKQEFLNGARTQFTEACYQDSDSD